MALKLYQFFIPLIFFFLALEAFIVQSKTSPRFIKNFQNLLGVEKGHSAIGLQDLKSYLKSFGYYDPNHEISLDNDEFDDHLQHALVKYQKFFNLNVTGTLNSNTIKQMTMPRCGVADIVHIKKNKINIHYPWFVSKYAFHERIYFPTKYHLTYRFSTSCCGDIDIQTLTSVISSAFQRWASVSQFTFAGASLGSKEDIMIGFYTGDHGDGAPFDGYRGVVAHSNEQVSPTWLGNTHFDGDENWSTDPRSDEMDLESVAVHEIGHLLGLAHTTDPKAIMYPIIDQGIIKRDLSQDDIDGIHFLYPN